MQTDIYSFVVYLTSFFPSFPFLDVPHLCRDFDNEKAGSLGRQLLAFVRGTQNALAENNVPFMNCVFEENSMFSWGYDCSFA